MKRIRIICAVFLSIIILGSVVVYGENIVKNIQVTYRNISIHVNGKVVPSEQEPFIYQGRTFVPLRSIGEAVNKTVEWDNTKNQVNITDKPADPSQNFLSFPIHKMGERIEAYPYALTIKKVYHGTVHKGLQKFDSETLFIEFTIESISKQVKMISSSKPFTLWDENNDKIAQMNAIEMKQISGVVNAFAYCTFTDNLKNKKITLAFYPVDTEYGDPDNEINVFLAFDLGKIE